MKKIVSRKEISTRWTWILLLSFYGCTHSGIYDETEYGRGWLQSRLLESKKPDQEIMDETLSYREIEQFRNYDEVKKWMNYFTHSGRKTFATYLERGQVYRPMIESILEQNNLPKSLYYLALIESGFSTHAASSRQAVGVWQFIAASGQRYGLQVDSYVDERRDPIRATWAATRYLKDLHNVFQSWFLAFSAYDTGEGRVLSAIMRKKTRNFWQLARSGVWVKETQEYAPKFLAAAILGENAQEFGFYVPQKAPYPTVKSVLLPTRLPLHHIAQEGNISLEQLQAVNPHILVGSLPPTGSSYAIWIPQHVTLDVERLQRMQPSVSKPHVRVESTSFASLARSLLPSHRHTHKVIASHKKKGHATYRVAKKGKRLYRKSIAKRALAAAQ